MRTAASLTALGISMAVVAGCSTATDGAALAPPPNVAATSERVPKSSTTPAPADLTSIKPCELLAHDEAEKLARTPLGKGVISPNRESPSCTYTGPPTGPTAQVELHLGPGAKKYFDIDNELSPLATLPGLADEAYTGTDGLRVYFRKGTIWVVMQLVKLSDHPSYVTALKSLAHTVADRIPEG